MKKYATISFVLTLIIVLIIAGCAQTAPAPAPSPAPTPAPTPAPAEATRYAFYTMKPGTSTYMTGVGLSALINRHTDLNTIVQPFPNPFGAYDTITKGVHHFNTQAAFSIYPMGLGIPDLFFPDIPPGQGYPKLRLIHKGYRQHFSWVARKGTDINSIADLKGKTVSATYKAVMPATVIARQELAAYGIDWQKDIKDVPFPSTQAAMNAVIDKKIDACLDSVKSTGIQELEFKHGAVLLPFPPEMMDKTGLPEQGIFNDNLPSFLAGVGDKKIPGIYTLSMWITGADVPDDVIYKATKAVLENSEEIVATDIDFSDFTKENAVPEYLIIPFHPGAIKYYKEVGVWNDAVQAKNDAAMEQISKVQQIPMKE